MRNQFLRYIAVGAWNTLSGYAVFAACVYLLRDSFPYSYLAATLLASLINITLAFLGYKWFVFRTRGGYLREWLRCLMVYSSIILLSLCLMPVLVRGAIDFGGLTGAQAPYAAGALMTVITVAVSFVGHRRFSFRRSAPEACNP